MNGPPRYSQRACPPFTAALLQREGGSSLELPGNKASIRVHFCIGGGCMWFRPLVDQNGTIVDGHCAVAITGDALVQLGAILQAATGVRELQPEKKDPN